MSNDDRSRCNGTEPGFSGRFDDAVYPMGNAAMAAGVSAPQARMLTPDEIQSELRRVSAPLSDLDLKSRFQAARALPPSGDLYLQDAWEMAEQLYDDLFEGKVRLDDDGFAAEVQSLSLRLCIAICELRQNAGQDIDA